MPATPPDDFDIDILCDGSSAPARLRLLRGGRPFGPVLDGGELVAVHALEGGDRLVFLHEGVPFEEGAYIYWLDGAGRLRGRAALSRMYATGHLRDLAPMGPRGVSFRFFGEDHWLAQARPARGLRGLWGRLRGRPLLSLTALRGDR